MTQSSAAPSSTRNQAGTWRPLLEGADADQAREVVGAIAEALRNDASTGGSLAGGSAGLALFYAYLNEARPGEGWDAVATEHLNRSVEALGEGIQWPTLYSGFTGVAWTVDHMQGRLLEPSDEDLNEEIDAALEEHLALKPWTRDYDLISGLAGYGLYGLDRVSRPSGRRILTQVIDQLDQLKVELDGGYTWMTGPHLLPEWQRELSPDGYYNLGLAHGVPAVIALLGLACAAGVEAERSKALLEGAVTWMMAQRQPEDFGSCYGTVVSIGGTRENHPSRVAWCYGDLGLCVALLWAARAVGRADWEAHALDVARISARRELAAAGARDAGLCHGSAGNGHIFNRLWQATGEDLFRDVARAWFHEALGMRVEGAGVAGYRAWNPGQPGEEKDPWATVPGFLEGAAGIGMAFMAALYPQVPDWDRTLMVSLPPRG